MKPLAIDLYCGLGGWAEGFLCEGFDVIGFDIEARPYPGQLVLQDVATLDGAQFAGAAAIVASPPCQAYSYRAMPWKRAKALPPPDNTLFDACFRIQREASEAAGRHIPMVVENVKGAQKWVGRARWHYGSYYLWGDVPALMPYEFSRKNNGGSWFAIAHNTTSGHRQNPDGRNPEAAPWNVKGFGGGWFENNEKSRMNPSRNPREFLAVKMQTAGPGIQYGGNFGWNGSAMRTGNSRSEARKQASALIAKIPFDLAAHIARCFYPH